MAGRLMPRLFDVVVDANGDPISGALMTTYVNNSTTLKTTWTTSALSVAHTNPIVADSAGRFPDIWGVEGETYRVKITDASNVLIYQSDDIIILGANPSGAIVRDFGADGRFQLYASAGVANFEGGDPSPDNSGGKLRIGGWNDTQADTLELDSAATTIGGTMAVSGDVTMAGDLAASGDLSIGGDTTFSGSITLSDGSSLINNSSVVKVTGRYYFADTIAYANYAGGTTTGDIIYWLPFSRALTIDAIAFNAATSAGGSNGRIGIYDSHPTTGLPRDRLDASGAISLATTGTKVATLSANIAVTARVWLAVVIDSGGVTLVNNGAAEGCTVLPMGATDIANGSQVFALYSTFPYAALPATAPAITGVISASVPILAVRAA